MKTRSFLLAAGLVLAMAFFLSCSEDLKPIERETLEVNAQTSSSSGGGEQKATVSGVSQKGPFLNRSSVTLYELGSNLVPTGLSFPGMTDEKGSFEIKGIELASPYALLKAEGYYRNEVTGGNSFAPITLYAIADMSNKSSANVNILTHLEYYRVQELAKSKSLADAKKQALGEILAVFGIDGSGFKGSEEMSIFGTGDADGALLAISILLQGDLSEGSFLALLADFSQKLKDGGVWDSKAKKSEMAEWASSADLAAIRGNIAGWGLSPDVPDFEKYIRSYAEANSPKGGCEPSENEFCHSGRIYDKCGDESGKGKHEYDPVTQFCHNNYTIDKCGGKQYEPPGERCNIGVIEKQCGTNWYDPSQYYCYNGSLSSCGNQPLNPDREFCSGGKIYDMCGGSDYNPATHFCLGSAITPLCGGQTFTSSQFCSGNTVYDKCGGTAIYDPETQSCTEASSSSAMPSSSSIVPSSSSVAPSSSSGGGNGNDISNYRTVNIGTQTWMAENLNYAVEGSKCYENVPANCNTYGRLYDWSTAMGFAPSCNTTFCSNQIQPKHTGICPAGWHIPSQTEWNILSSYVQSTSGCSDDCDAKLLKADSPLWNNNGKGTDEYGFSALPGGHGGWDGSFDNVGDYGGWWSTSEFNSSIAYYRDMGYYSDSTRWSNFNKSYLFSVRCLQD
jgi:uncharacterized protein (TIGR02145 family)